MSFPPAHPLLQDHWRRVAAAYEQSPARLGRAARHYRREVARQLRYFIPRDASVLEIGCGAGDLLALLPNRDIAGIDLAAAPLARARTRLPHGRFWQQAGEELAAGRTFDAIIVSDTLNLAADVDRLLQRLHPAAHDRTRLIVNFQNHLWQPVFFTASALGWRDGRIESSWLARGDVAQLCAQADWEIVRHLGAVLCPLPLLGADRLANRWLAPFFRPLCLTQFAVGRPVRRQPAAVAPTLSVIVPARNEAGHIPELLRRWPALPPGSELIFIEGGSTDDTWSALERAQRDAPELGIKLRRQTRSGKANAVREGFAAATGEILLIFDADLSTPPEDIPRFYAAIAQGRADFANGSRLVYPVEKEAMRFLNMCANKVFAWIFCWLLGQPIKDTLCGTKALRRRDYQRIVAQRDYFGEFDPFGDFDLLFGASKLGLKIVDIPVRYQERAYGRTNIQRWRHGWLLLRMTGFAARRIKFIG